ncbi:MAG TPA: hypothetical protein VIV57_13675 [Anaeromyxobacter sp.]
MPTRLALLAALALALPPAAMGGSGTARLLVSATVVRSVHVSVSAGAAGSAALGVSTSSGAAFSASVDAAAGAPGVGVAPSAIDPTYVVVTVLADGPLLPER